MPIRSTYQSYFIVISFLFVFSNAYAQKNVLVLKERIGDKYFTNMSYMQAIATYEDILKEDSTKTSVLPKLALSYKKISDTYNAERFYEKVVKLDSANAVNIWEYAQLLAINKKYAEASKQYERYARINPADKRGENFWQAYRDESFLVNNESKVSVTLVNFNSGQSDFSPAFFKRGLVFVSNRSYHTVIRRTFEWDQTAFLDLYFVEDTAMIRRVKSDTAAGKSKRVKLIYNDDDTRATSNDSRTMGYIGYRYVDTSAMFATPEIVINHFSNKIKSKYHEGPVTFTADEKTIIFTRNNYYNGRARKSTEGINKLKLFSAHIDDAGIWSDIKPLNINSNNYSVGHPSLAPGDTILYFASDMPGGFGGSDIYKSYWRNKEWSTPENLGSQINTAGNELFPYIDKEGILYFASNGHPGIGGLDLFKTGLTNIKVENLGIPINSSFDDFGIVLDATTTQGYLSSNRRRGINDDDIYKISLKKTIPFIIQVVDSISKELLTSAFVSVNDMNEKRTVETEKLEGGKFTARLWSENNYNINAETQGYFSKLVNITADNLQPLITVPLIKRGCTVLGTINDKAKNVPVADARVVITEVNSGDTVFDYMVGADGTFNFGGLALQKQYKLDISKRGYFNKPPVYFNTMGTECKAAIELEELKDFKMEEIVLGKAIKIDNIYFDLAKYNIRKDAAKELDKIVTLLQENPDIIIELSSHTDCRASYQYNMTLSDNRAKASAEYIITKGISRERITGKGYGETKLVNDCACEGKEISRVCTEEEHQANRRTEFKVTGFLSDKSVKILNNAQGQTPQSVPLPAKE
jgi:outer membrane protein OmpA-like peptidoglycan-associated protein/tetratricopeptide (TPR) repeat protein